MSPGPPCARDGMDDTILPGLGLRRHGPISVVGAPSRSYGYAVVAPPRIRGHAARNEAHQTCAELP